MAETTAAETRVAPRGGGDGSVGGGGGGGGLRFLDPWALSVSPSQRLVDRVNDYNWRVMPFIGSAGTHYTT